MTPRAEKTIAVGILVLVILGFGFVIGQPIWAVRQSVSAQVERESKRHQDLSARLAALIAEEERLSSIAVETIGWQGDRVGEVSARIQSEINLTARRLGLQLRSVTAIETEPLAGQETAGLRIEVEAPSDRAMSLIKALETTEPPILVSRMNVRRLNRNAPNLTQPIIYLRLELQAPVQITSK